MSTEFFNLYRKKGVEETLEILHMFENCEAKERLFFKKMNEFPNYRNSFFRVKNEMLKYKIIAYKLDEDNDRVIYLTEKGKKIYEKVQELEKILKDEND